MGRGRTTATDPDRLQSLIGQVYDAAIDPAQWQTFLANLDVTHGGAFLYEDEPPDRGVRIFAGANIPLEWKEPYETYYSKIKPWGEQLVRVRAGEVVRTSAWIDDASLRKTEYYNDCFARLDIFYSTALTLFREGKTYTAISLSHPLRVGDFTVDELRLYETLLPHLQRAVSTNRYLHAAALEREALTRGLERLAVGVILAAHDGRVLFANHVAEAVLNRGDGLSTQHQRLSALTPAVTQELHRRIREAADIGAGAGTQISGRFCLPCRSGDSMSLLICPFPLGAATVIGPTLPCALIFVAQSSQTTVHPSDLREIYGFTPAEAKLVGALLTGMPLRRYAAVHGISTETAKTQLRQVFAKTGQRRQADLIRQILSNPIVQLLSKERPGQQ